MDISKSWTEYTFVAFDTETSGAYPLGADIVEVGMVKWRNGQEIDRYQTFLKPRIPMSDFNMSIHGITNEMVADAPLIKEKIHEIRNFFKDCVLMAHHAPFDLGFLVVDLEKNKMQIPDEPVICTSLLSRKVIPESKDHKLQTLIPFLNLPSGTAHRAYDDARSCLWLGIECMKRAGEGATLEQIIRLMGKKIDWNLYQIFAGGSEVTQKVIEAIENHKSMDIVYAKGSVKGKPRKITPIGIVRNPDGDYIRAKCHIDLQEKRFYIREITDAQVAWS